MSRHNKGERRTTRRQPLPALQLTAHQNQLFCEWICQKQMDIETQIIRLQTRQNRLALQVADTEHRFNFAHYKGIESGAPFAQTSTSKHLLKRWEKLDVQIRCLRHIERLLAPLYFLAALTSEAEFVGDAVTLFFWEQCKVSFGHLTAMQEEVTL